MLCHRNIPLLTWNPLHFVTDTVTRITSVCRQLVVKEGSSTYTSTVAAYTLQVAASTPLYLYPAIFRFQPSQAIQTCMETPLLDLGRSDESQQYTCTLSAYSLPAATNHFTPALRHTRYPRNHKPKVCKHPIQQLGSNEKLLRYKCSLSAYTLPAFATKSLITCFHLHSVFRRTKKGYSVAKLQ